MHEAIKSALRRALNAQNQLWDALNDLEELFPDEFLEIAEGRLLVSAFAVDIENPTDADVQEFISRLQEDE